MEVDASDAGVWAILSQQVNGELHPCAFFSQRLSPAESNYNVGDRELLAIKLALEEWQHWLVSGNLDRPQELSLSPRSQETERPAGQVGSIFHTV